MTLRCRPLYSQLQTSQVLLAQRLRSNDLVAGSWIMPRLPVNVPRWGIATISPKGVTRFCKCIASNSNRHRAGHGRPSLVQVHDIRPIVPRNWTAPHSVSCGRTGDSVQRLLKAPALLTTRILRKLTCSCRFFRRHRLSFNEGALSFDSPSVTRDRSIVPHHPMTWNSQCDLIRSASPSYGPHSFGCTYLTGNLGIRDSLACGNVAEGLPYPLLKGGAADIER